MRYPPPGRLRVSLPVVMAGVLVRLASPLDREVVMRLRAALLPELSPEENESETAAVLAGRPPSLLPQAILVAVAQAAGTVVGFVYVGLRSVADGCDTFPVGYIEEWYVDPAHRRAGVGRALIDSAADWARAQGCQELASDAVLGNEISHAVHRALGFEEVESAVLYRRPLGPAPRRARWTRLSAAVGLATLLGFLVTGIYMRVGVPAL